MRLRGWRRRRNAGNEEFPEGLDAASAWDEQLSAYLDSELEGREAVAVQDALEVDPALAVQLDELSVVRDALGSLGELRAPRPFTLEAPPTAVRHAPGRLELVFRMGALAAAVAFAVVLTGDIVGLGDDGVEGWGISRPRFGGGSSEQASDAPQAAAALAAPASPAAAQAETAASTPQPAATSAAAGASPTATAAPATPTPEATTVPTAVAAAVSTAVATVAASPAAAADGASDASPAATTDTRTAGRAVESPESDATPAADQPATPTVAAGESQAAATEAAASADDAADEEDGAEAASPTEQAAATLAPAATATPAPSTRDEVLQEEPAGTDDSARALRRAEQWLLLAAVALAVLALGLGLRRRGGSA